MVAIFWACVHSFNIIRPGVWGDCFSSVGKVWDHLQALSKPVARAFAFVWTRLGVGLVSPVGLVRLYHLLRVVGICTPGDAKHTLLVSIILLVGACSTI